MIYIAAFRGAGYSAVEWQGVIKKRPELQSLNRMSAGARLFQIVGTE